MSWRLLVVLILSSLTGCTPTTSHDIARFTVRADRVITTDFVGFGGQMNPYLYCRPNWTGSPTTRPAQGAVDEENVAELERRVIELAPQHVRIFVQPEWFATGYDDYVAHGDPRMVESFLRTVRLAQHAGATVNLTVWHGPWPRPEEQARRFARLLDELINHQGLACVRYATIQNEPNNPPPHATDGTKRRKISFETYNTLYRALDDELRRLFLRDRIRIISGDLVADDQQEWLDDLATDLADVSDGYSMHAYWDYTDTPKLVRRLTEVRRIVDAMPPEHRRPIYCTEFGVRGRRPSPRVEPGDFVNADGTTTPVADTATQAVQIAWFNLLAINLGYRAAVQWELYDAWYDRLMPYGVIGDVTTGWKLKPAYSMLRLLTHTTQPGWQTLAVEGTSDDVIVSAMRAPNGEGMTVLVLNHSDHPRDVRIDGLPSDLLFRVITCDPGSTDSAPSRRGIAQRRRGSRTTIELTLPPRTLTALTTLDWNPTP